MMCSAAYLFCTPSSPPPPTKTNYSLFALLLIETFMKLYVCECMLSHA